MPSVPTEKLGGMAQPEPEPEPHVGTWTNKELTRKGESRYVDLIKKYWRDKGHKVDVRIESLPMTNSSNKPTGSHYPAVRSNLVNGLPVTMHTNVQTDIPVTLLRARTPAGTLSTWPGAAFGSINYSINWRKIQ